MKTECKGCDKLTNCAEIQHPCELFGHKFLTGKILIERYGVGAEVDYCPLCSDCATELQKVIDNLPE